MIEEIVYNALIAFAESHPEVLAIYKGNYHEDSPAVPHYHLLIKGSNFYDRRLENELRDLDLKLFRDSHSGIWYWPIPPREANTFPFLKQLIYSREQHKL